MSNCQTRPSSWFWAHLWRKSSLTLTVHLASEVCSFAISRSSLTQCAIVKLSFFFLSCVVVIRHFLTERYRNWVSWCLDVSPSWCRHFQFFGFLTCAPAANFARKRVKTRYLILFRATENCVVICRASLLYEMGYPFRSFTVCVSMEF